MITRRILGFLAGAAVMLTLVGIAANAEQFALATRRSDTSADQVSRGTRTGAEEPIIEVAPRTDERAPAELPDWVFQVLAAVGGVAAAIATIWFLLRNRFRVARRRRRATSVQTETRMTEEEQAETIADFAEELILELELGEEPRVAIQRVYATVETGMGSWELRRKAAETPLKYLERVFGRRKTAAPALARLTDLFQVARFSDEPLGPDARTEAIDALRELRDEYRTIARARVRA